MRPLVFSLRSLARLLIPTLLLISALSIQALSSQSEARTHAEGSPTTVTPLVPQPDEASSQTKPSSQPDKPSPLLPEIFAGWQISGSPQVSTDPRAADDGEAPVLREYGFARYEVAQYARDGDTLTIRAIEFGDATGAYGAFTFYRRPDMASEPVGQGGAFNGSRVLFWNGNLLIDAKFSRITAMSVSELRDLVTQLPSPGGNRSIAPILPNYLPARHLEPGTVQYAIGPLAYRQSGGVLPVDLVGFDKSAEVVTGQYNAMAGTGVLTIINYPTPEIAINRERAIRSYFSAHKKGTTISNAQDAWTSALANSNPAAIQSRRSGPLVAVTSGAFAAGSAQALLQRVHYDADLTMGNPTPKTSDTVKLAQLILSVAILVGIFALIAIIAGVSLGGGRVLWRKLRNEPEDDSAEFIRLNLK